MAPNGALREERDLRAEINKLMTEHDKSMGDIVKKNDLMLQLGTKAQQKAAAQEKLESDISKVKETQLALMQQMIDAENSQNMAAYLQAKIRLEQVTIQREQLELTEEMAGKMKELTSDLDAWQKKMNSIVALAKQMAQDWRVIGVVLGKATLEAGAEFKSWQQELGMSAGQAAQLGTNIASAGASGFFMGVSFEKTKAAGAALAKEMGTVSQVTSTMIKDAAYMADRFGVSAENAAKLTREFDAASKFTGMTAGETSDMVADMAEAANVPIGAVMEDMAGNMEHFAKYSDGSVKNMAKMAIHAKELGLNMGTVAKITDSLMDFESSMTAEMEASVILGRQINLNKARQLAYEGKTAEAAAEVLKQMGSISEFNKLGYHEREALAAAAGMEVSELRTALQLKEKSREAIAKWGPFMAGALEWSSGFASNLMDAGKWAANNATEIAAMAGAGSNVLKWMKQSNKLGWISVLIQKTKNGLAKIGIGGGSKPDIKTDTTPDLKPDKTKGPAGKGGVGKGLKDLASGLKAMGNSKVTMGIFNMALAGPAFVLAIPAIPFLLFMGLTPLAGLAANFKGLAQGLKAMSKAAIGALVMAIVGPALALSTLAIPFLAFMAIPGIGTAWALNFSLLATGLTTFGNPATAIFILIGIGLLALLGAALIPFAFALSLITPLVEAFGNIIIGVFQAIGPVIESVGKAISSVIGALGGFFTVLGSLDPLQILMLAPGLAALGLAGVAMLIGAPGFIAMALGISLLAGALYLMLPLMPMIETLASLGIIGSVGEGSKGGTKPSDKNPVVEKLDELIDLTKKGQVIVMNGQKVGQTALAAQRVYK
jgi:hypothetical protein